MLGDRYELDHEIGREGTGSMWLGHDTVLNRAVAMKRIGMVSGGTTPDLARAKREAHLAARINHHNVISVFDIVDDGHHQWLIMEYVDGPSLAGLVAERGALQPGAMATVLAQVASALAAAHEHGIVHRDIKPSNILLTKDGTAKLSDFGVARAHTDEALTMTGLVTGTPAYLSPEVAIGGTATAASDVWSLGASFFFALAGHPPYDVSGHPLDALHRIGHDEPPRLEQQGPLARTIESMMQRDPAARPSLEEIERAASEVAESSFEYAATATEPIVDPELDATQGFSAVKDDPAPTHVSETPRRSHRLLYMVVGVAAAIIAIVVFVMLGGDDPVDPAAEQPRAEPSTTQSTRPSADEGPTAAELEGFAADYLTTASNDPDEGFTLLTPAYQQESGGIDGYKDFWSGVSDLDVETVQGNPDDLTVSYTYSYEFDGDRRTEDITLQLEESDDSYLISGTA